jgi:hypothetical protein
MASPEQTPKARVPRRAEAQEPHRRAPHLRRAARSVCGARARGHLGAGELKLSIKTSIENFRKLLKVESFPNSGWKLSSARSPARAAVAQRYAARKGPRLGACARGGRSFAAVHDFTRRVPANPAAARTLPAVLSAALCRSTSSPTRWLMRRIRSTNTRTATCS